MNNNIIRIFLFCVACVIYSCSTSNFYGDEKLGVGYFLYKKGRYKSINYTPDENYKGEGVSYIVIKEQVKKINYNKAYIIVQTSRYEKPSNEVKEFWVIDKSVPINLKDFKNQEEFDELLKVGLTGPLDSVQFYRLIQEKNIDLRFKD
jgi:hypothetical protein